MKCCRCLPAPNPKLPIFECAAKELSAAIYASTTRTPIQPPCFWFMMRRVQIAWSEWHAANARCKQFLLGMYSTALEPDELLVSVDVPRLPAEFGSCLSAHSPFATADSGRCRGGFAPQRCPGRVRLAVGCVGPMAVRLTELEAKIYVAPIPTDIHKTIRRKQILLEANC